MNIDIIGILTEIINKFGYLGIFLVTALEYACFPISSELLLPFIGYSISKGDMSFIAAVIASTVGGATGSFTCYMGGRFGIKFIEKTVLKRFKTVNTGLNRAKKCFNKYGKQSVLMARVFPIARTYISFPAGIAKMNIGEFMLFSSIGAFVWNVVLIYIGFTLGEHFEYASETGIGNKIFIIMLLIAMAIFWILSFSERCNRKNRIK